MKRSVTSIRVLAGSLESGCTDDGPTCFDLPQSLCQPDARTLIIADRSNGRVCKYDLESGTLSTLATTGEGSAPCSVCVDPSHSDQLLVAFAGLQKCIRRIRADGAVEVLANSDSQFASVDCLLSTALNSDAEPTLYVSSVIDHTVKAMNTHTGEVREVLNGDDQAESVDPFALVADSQGRLVMTCLASHTIARFDPKADSNVELLAGQSKCDGFEDGQEALFGELAGIDSDPFDTFYVCDCGNGAIRALNPDGLVYTLVSSDPEFTPVAFEFESPVAIIFDRFAYQRGHPRLFVLDFHRLIQIDLDPSSIPPCQEQSAHQSRIDEFVSVLAQHADRPAQPIEPNSISLRNFSRAAIQVAASEFRREIDRLDALHFQINEQAEKRARAADQFIDQIDSFKSDLHDEFNGLQTQWAEQHQKIVVIADHLENRALETSRQLSDCMLELAEYKARLARVEETQQSQRDEIAAAMSEMRQMLVMSKAQSNTQRVSLQVPQTPSSVEDASLKDEVVALRNITSTFPEILQDIQVQVTSALEKRMSTELSSIRSHVDSVRLEMQQKLLLLKAEMYRERDNKTFASPQTPQLIEPITPRKPAHSTPGTTPGNSAVPASSTKLVDSFTNTSRSNSIVPVVAESLTINTDTADQADAQPMQTTIESSPPKPVPIPTRLIFEPVLIAPQSTESNITVNLSAQSEADPAHAESNSSTDSNTSLAIESSIESETPASSETEASAPVVKQATEQSSETVDVPSAVAAQVCSTPLVSEPIRTPAKPTLRMPNSARGSATHPRFAPSYFDNVYDSD